MSESLAIANRVANWIAENNLCLVFGGNVYEGHTANNKKFKAVDFCIPRYLDGTVKIFHKNYISVFTTNHNVQFFKSEEEMMKFMIENFGKRVDNEPRVE